MFNVNNHIMLIYLVNIQIESLVLRNITKQLYYLYFQSTWLNEKCFIIFYPKIYLLPNLSISILR